MSNPSDEVQLAIDRLLCEGWDDSAKVILDLFHALEKSGERNIRIIQRLKECRDYKEMQACE